MAYKIIGDSCTDLTEQMKKDSHIKLIPLTLQVDGKEIIDDETFNQKEFIKLMKESQNPPKSACPAPEAYLEAYKEDADIYVVTLSSQLSGSYNSAEVAKKMYFEEFGEKNIVVIDSKSASVGQTLLVMKIQELIESGYAFDEVVKQVLQYREEQNTKFVLETLDVLQKNGRLSTMKALICNTLNIKPIMTATPEGRIDKEEQARGMSKALKKMAECVAKDVINPTDKILGIAHCNALERAEYTKERILELVPFKEVVIVEDAGVSTMYANEGGIIVAY